MAVKKSKAPTPENEELYRYLIETVPGIEIKGATMPYTSLNGNMFSFLKDGKVALRLPDRERGEFLKKYKSTLFEAYGITMTEYEIVSETLMKKTGELKAYVNASYAYAKTLKAKPTRKK